jgi:signal transduction histidine kinase
MLSKKDARRPAGWIFSRSPDNRELGWAELAAPGQLHAPWSLLPVAARCVVAARGVGLVACTLLLRDSRGARLLRSASPCSAAVLVGAGALCDVHLLVRHHARNEHLESELRQTIQKLAEADQRKNQFLATLAHELRNPLAPISTGVQIVQLSVGADHALQPTAQMKERQMKYLVRLVDDVLDISRINRGKVSLRTERVPLEPILKGALEMSWGPKGSRAFGANRADERAAHRGGG